VDQERQDISQCNLKQDSFHGYLDGVEEAMMMFHHHHHQAQVLIQVNSVQLGVMGDQLVVVAQSIVSRIMIP
jgi:hypothetical protein